MVIDTIIGFVITILFTILGIDEEKHLKFIENTFRFFSICFFSSLIYETLFSTFNIIPDYKEDFKVYNDIDFDKSVSKKVNQLKKAYKYIQQVGKTQEDNSLTMDLIHLWGDIYTDIVNKCNYKFRNGKYVLLKPKNKIYLLINNRFSISNEQLQKTKKKKKAIIKKDKFSKIREFVKEVRTKSN